MRDTEVSKTLSYVLRHAAVQEGIPIRSDGYVLVGDLLSHKLFTGVAEAQIRQIVASSDKKRFQLMTNDSGQEWIRAVQGHSIKLDGMDYEQIMDPKKYPTVLHGTYMDVLPFIEAEGLKRMARTHIHFAPALPEGKPISGMRGSAEVVIEIDMEKAMADGIKFYVSVNGVILSEGIDGILPPSYFKSISFRKQLA